MSDLLKHVLVGDLIGRTLIKNSAVQYNNPISAFGLGIISHAVMDTVEPDYTVDWFNREAFLSSSPYLLFQMLGLSVVLKNSSHERSRGWNLIVRLAAVLGSVIPDIIDGIYSLLNPHAWYSGELIFPWHSPRFSTEQRMSMVETSILTTLLAGLCYIINTSRFRWRPGPRPTSPAG